MRRSVRWCVDAGIGCRRDQRGDGRQRVLRAAARAPRLVARGDDVRLFDIDVTGADGLGADVIHGDIRDPAAVRRAVEGADVVFHNVAQVPLARDRHLLRSVNVDGTQVLLDACAAADVAKVVHTSSSAVFGVPETNPVLPTTVPEATGALRAGQARRRVGVPARPPARRDSTSRSSGRGRSSGTDAWASSGSCSTGSPTATTRSCSATAPTATSSSTPTTSPRPACSPLRGRARRCSTSAPTGSARWPRR